VVMAKSEAMLPSMPNHFAIVVVCYLKSTSSLLVVPSCRIMLRPHGSFAALNAILGSMPLLCLDSCMCATGNRRYNSNL